MPKHAFRIRFSIPAGTQFSGDSVEADMVWRDQTVRLSMKSYYISPGSGTVLYECYGKHFDTLEDGTECGTNVVRFLMKAALSLGRGVNLWEDSVPGYLTGYPLSMNPPISEGTLYADLPGLQVYEDTLPTSFVHVELKDASRQCSLQDLVSVLVQSASSTERPRNSQDLALTLVSIASFEPYSAERFLVLVSALETLTRQDENSSAVQKAVDRLVVQVGMDTSLSVDGRNQLTARLQALKSVSHTSAILNMVEERLGKETYGGMEARAFAGKCHDQRGRMLHDGAGIWDRTAIGLLPELQRMVYEILGISPTTRRSRLED
jgi:hypothetical protein